MATSALPIAVDIRIHHSADNSEGLTIVRGVGGALGALPGSAARNNAAALLRKPEVSEFEGMIGASPALHEMIGRIQRIAPYYRMAVVTGETGTGKELAARALHNLSPVRSARFVVLNCTAVVETLYESELFGHVRGSFTGADRDKMGLFEFADRGTLFLDEIGEMPMATQAKLLRVLQNQEVLRVGSLVPRKIDVRVIAATNRDLRKAVEERTFREDLFYRLAMVEIRTPPLVERKQDIPMLTGYFIEKFSRLFRKPIGGLTTAARVLLQRHNWPGNIRELENVLGHGCMMAAGEMVGEQDLPEYMGLPGRSRRCACAKPEPLKQRSASAM